MMLEDVDLAPMLFSDASDVWLQTRSRYLKPDSYRNYVSYRRTLNVFFGKLILHKIHAGHIREYQGMREANFESRWNRAAGPSTINHEVSMLAQVLERANLWKKVAPHYEPVPLPKQIPKRVLDHAEEAAFTKYVPTTEEELLAYLVATITNNTSASGCELRGLRLRDVFVFVDDARIHVPDDSVKNEHRARVVPLNRTAKSAFEQCLELAKRKGSFAPEHYVFPIRIAPPSEAYPHGRYDPMRPASPSWLTKTWGHLRVNAGLGRMRPHDFRHQFITRALEKGADEKHLMEITGHISPKILKEYSHMRMKVKRTLVDMLDSHAAPKRTRRRA